MIELSSVVANAQDRDAPENKQSRSRLHLRRQKTASTGSGARGRVEHYRSPPAPAASPSYQSCASINSPRAAGVKITEYTYGQRFSSSALRDAHVTPLRLSSSSELRRYSSSSLCALVKGRCSCSRLSQSCAISARRSGGVKRTISSGLSNPMPSSPRKEGRAALLKKTASIKHPASVGRFAF